MKIAVGFITYPVHKYRLDRLRTALAAKKFITASQDDLVFFCTCESQCQDRAKERVRELCSEFGVSLYWSRKPPSMGANENNAMAVASDQLNCDYLMIHIDDCYAIEPVDLSEGIAFLEANPDIDILRYHWSSRKEAAPIVERRPDGWDQVMPRSKWFYDDSPHVRRSDCAKKFGWHLEGKPADSGPIEREMIRRLRDKKASIVATPYKRFEKNSLYSASRPGQLMKEAMKKEDFFDFG